MNRREFLKSLLAAACVGAVAPLDALASWWGESLTLVDIVFDDGWQKAVSIRGSPSLIDNLSLDVTVQFDREKLMQHAIVQEDNSPWDFASAIQTGNRDKAETGARG